MTTHDATAETAMPAQAAQPDELASSDRPRITGDLIAEIVFLSLVAAVFIYYLVASRTWPIGAALLPRVAALVGLPLLAAHVYMRLRPSRGPKRQILDMGFADEDVSKADVRPRTFRMIGSMVALFVGIWLVGFHIALPAYIFLYLLFWGGAKWYWALVAGLFFEGLLIGLYDNTLHMAWNDPVLQQLLGITH